MIEISLNEEQDAGCNVCPASEINNKEPIFRVSMKMGSSNTIIRLCKNHLKEMKEKIESVL